MTKESFAARLRKDIAQALGPEAGTVIRFDCVIQPKHFDPRQSERRYTYAAVFANNHWYLTGQCEFFGANSFTHGQFISEVLTRNGVDNIAVATGFELV